MWKNNDDGSLIYEDSSNHSCNRFSVDINSWGYIKEVQIIFITDSADSISVNNFAVYKKSIDDYPLNNERCSKVIGVDNIGLGVYAKLQNVDYCSVIKLDNGDYKHIYNLYADWENLYLTSHYRVSFSNTSMDAKKVEFKCLFQPSDLRIDQKIWIKPCEITYYLRGGLNQVKAQILPSDKIGARVATSYCLVYSSDLIVSQVNYSEKSTIK